MANEQNLIPGAHKLTVEEQSRGGNASVESRREKKRLRECLEMLLESDVENEDGEKISGAEAIATAMFLRACAGDTKAAVFVRDTAGQKPVEKSEATVHGDMPLVVELKGDLKRWAK